MRSRRYSGAVFALVPILFLVLAVITAAFFIMSKMLGGGRQLQSAVDSGSLNVARLIAKNISVPLQGQIEKDNFIKLTDRDSRGMNLLSINRAIGQAILVAANAKEIGTEKAKQRAKELLDVVQAGPQSLSSRLSRRLEESGSPETYFRAMAHRNSTHMLSSDRLRHRADQYRVGWVNRGTPNNQGAATNVSIDPARYPLLRPFLSNVPDPNNEGHLFLKGYSDIEFDFGAAGRAIVQGVTLNPGQSPHLISASIFQENSRSPYENRSGAVPPNAFRSAALLTTQEGNTTMEAASVVAALGSTFPASFQGGYIKVINPPGIPTGHAPCTSVNNPTNNELLSGVHIANNDAFSTSRQALEKWITFNNRGRVGQRPSGVGIFDRAGNNASPAVLERITAMGDPCSRCTYLNLSGTGQINKCTELYPSFLTAYGFTDERRIRPLEYLAIEYSKHELIDRYFISWSNNGICQQVGPPPRPTGLRKYDRLKEYVAVPQGNPWDPRWTRNQVLIRDNTIKFSTAGTIREYLKQIGTDTNGRNVEAEVLARLRNMLLQIKPNMTQAEFDSIVDMTEAESLLELNTTFYIYQRNGRLVITQRLPEDVNLALETDGVPDTFRSSPFPVVGKSVNPLHELGIHYALFTEHTPCNPVDPASVLRAHDLVQVTRSSGFGNLLGEIRFGHGVQGCSQFCAPN